MTRTEASYIVHELDLRYKESLIIALVYAEQGSSIYALLLWWCKAFK